MNNSDVIDRHIKELRNDVFSWGKNDCCLFVADIVLEITGIDYAKEFRGRYNTRLGAMRFLSKNGGIEALFKTLLSGLEADDLRYGDIVIFEGIKEVTAGIYNGMWLVGPSPEGVAYRPPDNIIYNWRVF